MGTQIILPFVSKYSANLKEYQRSVRTPGMNTTGRASLTSEPQPLPANSYLLFFLGISKCLNLVIMKGVKQPYTRSP